MRINKLMFFFLIILFSCNEQKEFLSYENIDMHIKTLSSDEMLGRDPYTEDIKIAENYIAGKFQQAGLAQFPEFNNYRHSFPLYLSELDKGNTYLSINGSTQNDVVFIASGDINYKNLTADQLNETFTITEVKKDDNPRNVVYSIIRNYTKNWIWLDPAHKNTLSGLKRFMNRTVSSSENPETDPRCVIIAIRPAGRINSIDLEIKTETREITLTNIVGYLEGTDPDLKDEFFVFSGHHDHLGYNNELEGDDKIYNGADDNATGVTGVITLAEHYSQLKTNKRSIMFVTFTCEEKGLLGAKRLVEDLPFPQDNLIGMINFEMLGKKSQWGWNRTFLTGFDKSDLGEIMKAAIPDTSVFNVYPDPYVSDNRPAGLFFNSDNGPFARVGIPSHSLSSSDVGSDNTYHQVTDEYETLNIENIFAVIKGVAEAVKPILSGAKTPSRVDIER
ncbi:MAG: M28 family peptidase [bacterium]|nr:M28 family peptidase [bacterium]